MTTSNYKLDTRYALVDTDTIKYKKNIIYTEAIIFFHSISDSNHIIQNTEITSQLSSYTITPILHNHVVAHIQIIIIMHTRYFYIIITVDRKRITPCNINKSLGYHLFHWSQQYSGNSYKHS